jgi:hypothetical protein
MNKLFSNRLGNEVLYKEFVYTNKRSSIYSRFRNVVVRP